MNAKQMREKRGALVEQMQGMVAAAKAEGRNLSNEENEKFDAISNEVDELRSAAARIERAEELPELCRYRGLNGLNAEELRAMQELRGTSTQVTTNDGLGGFLVPENWSDFVSATELFKSDIERVATVIRTSNGQPFNLPANDDTSVVAAILGEGTAETVSDMTFTNVKFEPYTYSSKIVKVSNQLMADNAFDLGSFVGGQLSNRLNRGINAHLTTGTNSSQPQGIVTGSTLGKTAASATAVTIAEILDLMYAVDASYRNAAGAAFMMNSATFAAVRKLGFGSSNDFPVVIPAMEAGAPDLLFGKPVYINEDMDGIATGKKSIIFGDMKQYYVHEAGGVQLLRLSERFADSLSQGFIAYRRVDGNVLQGSAIKHLIQA